MHAELALLFMLGSFFYINREFIEIRFGILISLLTIFLLLKFIFLAHEIHFFSYMKCIVVAYSVILIGYHPLLRIKSLDSIEDMSYGIYIYAFPIQQLIAYLVTNIQPFSMFLIATIATIPIAIVSYRLVERPFIKLNSKF
jgi:peptidoglycan/LPS O-acetylase OafA/YrhL